MKLTKKEKEQQQAGLDRQRERFLRDEDRSRSFAIPRLSEGELEDLRCARGYDPAGVGEWSRRSAGWPNGERVMRRESTLRRFHSELSKGVSK